MYETETHVMLLGAKYMLSLHVIGNDTLTYLGANGRNSPDRFRRPIMCYLEQKPCMVSVQLRNLIKDLIYRSLGIC